MSELQSSSRFELPPIPDYPDSPLSAWKHYGITNFAGQKIQDKLDSVGYSGSLIGLGVRYRLTENAESYSMTFGKIGITDLPENEFPLSEEFDNFLADLYEVVSEFVIQNIPEHTDEFDLELMATFKASPAVGVIIKCRKVQAGECTHAPSHKDTKRKCKSTNNGTTWTCLGGNTCS